MRESLLRTALDLLAVLALSGCTPHALVDSGGSASQVAIPRVECAPGREGCPCDSEGESQACGEIVNRSGGYVTCAMGSSVCSSGVWGACHGTSTVTKSLRGATLAASGGLQLQTITSSCIGNPCDPAASPRDGGLVGATCTIVTAAAADVDATAITEQGEGGVTLVPAPPPTCTGMQCQIPSCPTDSPTTLAGQVFDPAGNNPIANATVYIPADPTKLPALTAGASCSTCAPPQTIDAVAMTQTGGDGTFTLTNVPATSEGASAAIPLVIQLGKWRRLITVTTVPACATTPVDTSLTRLPGQASVGDMPQIAIVSGSNDPLECLLLKIGIDPSEFTLPTGTGHVHFFQQGGLNIQGQAPPGASLYGSPNTMQPYDLILLPCDNESEGATYAANLQSYVDNGGRALLAHKQRTWLTTPANGTNELYAAANWNAQGQALGQITAHIDTTVATGATFATWLQNTTPPVATPMNQLSMNTAFGDMSAVNPPATEWLTAVPMPGGPLHFSVDTPVASVDGGASPAACGRVEYDDFHTSTADLVQGGGAAGGPCGVNADCGSMATCIGSMVGSCQPETCASTAGDCTTGYSCVHATGGTCEQSQPCTSNGDCSSGLCTMGMCSPSAVSCILREQCKAAEACTGVGGICIGICQQDSDCAGGELCINSQCSGCYDSTYCGGNQPNRACNAAKNGTCVGNSMLFPQACLGGPLTPQEVALEFMFFNLNTCPSPPTSAYTPAFTAETFEEDFVSTCPMGTHVVWRALNWEASLPGNSQIIFQAETVAPPLDGGAPDWTTVTTPINVKAVTSATPSPGTRFLETGLDSDGAPGDGAFDVAGVTSEDDLRLIVQLLPTSDGLAAPQLISWSVTADCLPSE